MAYFVEGRPLNVATHLKHHKTGHLLKGIYEHTLGERFYKASISMSYFISFFVGLIYYHKENTHRVTSLEHGKHSKVSRSWRDG